MHALKTPGDLSPRIKRLRDYYFRGVDRPWNNEFSAWTTGTPWDFQFNELTFYVVPETYQFFSTFRASFGQAARPVALPYGFWRLSLPERRAVFIREVMTGCVPQEILPGDLIAGAVQRDDFRMPHEAGGSALREARDWAGWSQRGNPLVPQPRLRQRGSHQRPPGSRLPPCPFSGLARHP